MIFYILVLTPILNTIFQVEQVVLDDILYTSPDSHPEYYFSEHFDDVSVLGDKWIKSQVLNYTLKISIFMKLIDILM